MFEANVLVKKYQDGREDIFSKKFSHILDLPADIFFILKRRLCYIFKLCFIFFKRTLNVTRIAHLNGVFGNFFPPRVIQCGVILIDRKLYRHLIFFV